MKKKIFVLLWVMLFWINLSFVWAINNTEVEQKTEQLKKIVKVLFDSPKYGKAKFYEPVRWIFNSCSKTCKNEINKQAAINLVEHYDERFWDEDPMEALKESLWEMTSTENEKVVSADKKSDVQETNVVTVDWIEYTLKTVHIYDWIGNGNTKYNDYRKFPENDKWLIIEYTAKNTNTEDKYEWDFTLVSNWNQYDESTTARVYWEYQLWNNKHSTKLKPDGQFTTFQWFDVKEEDIWKWILYVQGRLNDWEEVKVDLSKIPVKNH